MVTPTTMFSAKELPWHNLGTIVDSAQTWQDASRLARLDWTVRKEPLFDMRSNKVDAYGIFRDDDNAFLGAVGTQYEPIQNSVGFEFIDSLIGAGATYETAGAFDHGRQLWALAKIPDTIRINGTNDLTEGYLMFGSSHDGSLACTSKMTTIRIVCMNTFTKALNQELGGVIRIKHTANALHRLEAAKVALARVSASMQDLGDKLNFLATYRVTRDSFAAVLEKLFPGEESTRKENKMQAIAELYHSNDSNVIPQIAGTGYALWNAITAYTDHHAAVRDTGKGLSESALRTRSAMWGSGSLFKEKALGVLLDTAQASPVNVQTVRTRFARLEAI